MKRFLMALIVVSMVALSGCTFVESDDTQPEATENTDTRSGIEGEGVERVVDEEAGVVCYKFTGYNKGGISCVPLNETDLQE